MESTSHIDIFHNENINKYSIKASEINNTIKIVADHLNREKSSFFGSIVLEIDSWENVIAKTVREWLYLLPCIQKTSQNIRNLEAGLNSLQTKRLEEKKFWKLTSLPNDLQDSGHVSYNLNLDKILQTSISQLTRNCLLQLTFNDPDRQIEILKKSPLDATSIYYHEEKDTFHYPRLAEKTIDFLLQDSPSVWTMVICSQQRKGLLDKFKDFPVDELISLSNHPFTTRDNSLVEALFKILTLKIELNTNVPLKKLFAILHLYLVQDIKPDKNLVDYTLRGIQEIGVKKTGKLIDAHIRFKIIPYLTKNHQLIQKCSNDDLLQLLVYCVVAGLIHDWENEFERRNYPGRLKYDFPLIFGSNVHVLYGEIAGPDERLPWEVIHWICQGNIELLRHYLCYLKYIGISFKNFDIEGALLAKLSQKERCLWWLAYAVNVKVLVKDSDSTEKQVLSIPEAPDWVRNEIIENYQFYAEFLYDLNSLSTEIEKRLASICQALRLKGLHLKEFGSYLSALFNPRLKELVNRPFDQQFLDDLIDGELARAEANSKELNRLNEPFVPPPKDEAGFLTRLFRDDEFELRLRALEDRAFNLEQSQNAHLINEKNPMSIHGFPMVNILRKALIYENAPYKIEDSWKEYNNHYFSIIPTDILIQLFQDVSIFNTLNVAKTCRRLYHRICGEEGSPIWKSLGLGSLGAIRHITDIFKKVTFFENPCRVIISLRNVLYRTWPSKYLYLFHDNFSSLPFPRKNNSQEEYYSWINGCYAFGLIWEYGLPFEILVESKNILKNEISTHNSFIEEGHIIRAIERDHPYFDMSDVKLFLEERKRSLEA